MVVEHRSGPGNPFSDVALATSSSEEDDEHDDDSRSDSSSSQIVSTQSQPLQRVRLLATFRLSRPRESDAKPPCASQDAFVEGSDDTLQVFRPLREQPALATSAHVVHTFQHEVPRYRRTHTNTPHTMHASKHTLSHT